MTDEQAMKYLYKTYINTKNASLKDALSVALYAMKNIELIIEEREKGCNWCEVAETCTTESNKPFIFCPMCGRRLEEHHEAD